MIDTSTGYGERKIVDSRSGKTMMAKFETIWLCSHGAPRFFSADPDLCLPFFVKYLAGHGVKVNQRTARSAHKNGRIERSKRVFKYIYEKIGKENSNGDAHLATARTSFSSKRIFERSSVCAFKLTRGYLPEISGLRPKIMSTELMDAYIKTTVYRAIQKAIKSRNPKIIPRSLIKTGDMIFVL